MLATCIFVYCACHDYGYTAASWCNTCKHTNLYQFNWSVALSTSLPCWSYQCCYVRPLKQINTYWKRCWISHSQKVTGKSPGKFTFHVYRMAQNFDGGKFWRMGNMENFDEKILTNSIMLTPTFINGWRDWREKQRGRL